MAIRMCCKTAQNFRKCHADRALLKVYQRAFMILCQHLTSSQVATALRPFFFLVHPDLFARYPKAQHINDFNLKVLNNHLDSLVKNVKKEEVDLQFYIKSESDEEILRLKSLQLKSNSAKVTVQSILSSFKLPTNYVDNLQDISSKKSAKFANYYYTSNFAEHIDIPQAEIKDDLYSWMLKNMGEAEKRLSSSLPIRKDISRLHEELIKLLQVKEVSWERGIGTTHLRGCLQGLKSLATHYPQTKYLLQGRQVHFGNQTGISLKGSVILSTSEVRDQWHKMISNIPSSDTKIEKIPYMQKAVSITLRDIQVTHRKYQPFLLAESYSQHLRRLVTSLGDFLGKSGFPKDWPPSLAHLQLVVESANGPLMLSPTGQILAPSSCPPSLLVNFISENMDEASQGIQTYQITKNREKELHAICLRELSLSFLDKDDSVGPESMLICLQNLLDNSDRISPLLSGARLWITHYYSVMLDGEVCIPWDWR